MKMMDHVVMSLYGMKVGYLYPVAMGKFQLVNLKGGKNMLRVFKQMNVRNRAYVIDNKGNKLFYGTVYQCGKFINYMNEGGVDDESGVNGPGREIAREQVRNPVEQ